jgi:transposase InsO family protein
VEEYFGISRSTLYRWLHRIEAQAPSRSAPHNKTPADLSALVWEIARANPHWGRHRIARQIALLDIFLAASTVRNILNRPRPVRPPVIDSAVSEVIPEKQTRSIPARYPNHVWSVDLTTVLRWGVWPLYVLVAIDHFSRKIVAVCPLEGPNSGWVIDAMDATFDRFGTPKHIITDKGSVFTGGAFAECLGARHIKPRTGAVGKHGSIAVTERAIKTLKVEWLQRVPLIRDFDHLQCLCDEFTLWYNEWRPHSTAGGTPGQRYRGAPSTAPPRDAKHVPERIERRTFSEARVEGFRLPQAA